MIIQTLGKDKINKIKMSLLYIGFIWWAGFNFIPSRKLKDNLHPLNILSLGWRGGAKYGDLDGMIVGATTIFIVKNYVKIEGEYFYELLSGFFLAFAAIVVVSSMLTEKPSEETLDKFDQAQMLQKVI